MNTEKIQRKSTLMIAHRGVSGLERENTTLAFVAAGNRSYFGIETDIHCTSDGNFIIIHDDTTTRVTGIEKTVEETDFATLRSMKILDLDGSDTREDLRMPTLEEYIGICKKYEKIAVLELKNHMEKADVHRIMDIIDGSEYLGNTVFISFDFENLVYVREKAPSQTVQFLFKDVDDKIITNVKKHKFDVDVYYRSLTEDIIKSLHSDGIKVNCWTVNSKETAEQLINWGVDFITTNILE